MGKTTNILDLNNRLTKVEKENIAQNNYNSLKNRPKINGNLLTGDKTSTQLGLANAQDIGNLSDLNTTDKSSCVGAINEVNGKANTYGTYTISNATSLSDFFFKLAAAADNDLSNKPDSVIYNIMGIYENVDLFYGMIERTGLHNYFFTCIRSFGSKMYCGYVDITNSSTNLYEYSGTLVS